MNRSRLPAFKRRQSQAKLVLANAHTYIVIVKKEAFNTMFSDTADAVAFGKHFVFEKRALEIATRGFSDTALPKKGLKKPFDTQKLDNVLNRIDCALEEQEDILYGLTAKIARTSRIAVVLQENNQKMALNMMEKVKSYQQESVHTLRVIAGMKAYKTHVKNSLQHLKNVDSTLKSLKNVPWNKKTTKASTDALLKELDSECFFPSMDAQGKITLHDEPTLTFRKRCSITESTASSGSFGL
eukprot:scaffold5380_cov131-Cylindrotheca_fusiformis.AAC.26